jgi:hypothetical protein
MRIRQPSSPVGVSVSVTAMVAPVVPAAVTIPMTAAIHVAAALPVLQEPQLFAHHRDFGGAGDSPAIGAKDRLWLRLYCVVGQAILGCPLGPAAFQAALAVAPQCLPAANRRLGVPSGPGGSQGWLPHFACLAGISLSPAGRTLSPAGSASRSGHES